MAMGTTSKQPRVLVLRAAGTNCDRDAAQAFEMAGATAEMLHINALMTAPKTLQNFDILTFPGGFSYGDDLGSGKVLATEIRTKLAEALANFLDAQKLVLGICNGFQVLVKSGLLPHGVAGLAQPAHALQSTLTWNDSQHYECRWVHCGTMGEVAQRSPFLRGIERMWLPIAHAEGKFIATAGELAALEASGQAALKYIDPATGTVATEFPQNPNGSLGAIAGLLDATGRIFGLMPHPERHIAPHHRPDWTRHRDAPPPPDGLSVFVNAVDYARG